MKGIFKDKLNDFELPVSDGIWANVSSQIGQAPVAGVAAKGLWSAKGLWIAAISVTTLAGLSWVILAPKSDEKEITQVIEPSTTDNQAIVNTEELPLQNQPSATQAGSTTPLSSNGDRPQQDIGPAMPMEEPMTEIRDSRTPELEMGNQGDPEFTEDEKSNELTYREHVANLPIASALFDVELNQNGSAKFKAQHSNGIAKYYWSFGDGQTSNDAKPQHEYETSGTFEVELTVTDAESRTMTSTQQIDVVRKGDLRVVNVITPNQDGDNDVFDPTALEPEAKINYLLILHQNGDQIYESTVNTTWDGRLSNGDECAAGVYLYLIRGLDKNKGIIEKSSKLTVIR